MKENLLAIDLSRFSKGELERMWDEADDKGQCNGLSAGQISSELARRSDPEKMRRFEAWKALNQQGHTAAEVGRYANLALRRVSQGTPDGSGVERVFYRTTGGEATIDLSAQEIKDFIQTRRAAIARKRE